MDTDSDLSKVFSTHSTPSPSPPDVKDDMDVSEDTDATHVNATHVNATPGSTQDAQEVADAAVPEQPKIPERSSLYFFEDGNVCMTTGDKSIIYKVHRSLLSQAEAFAGMFLLPVGPEGHEGTETKPIVLVGVPKERMDTLLWMFYGMRTFLDCSYIPGEQLLEILDVAKLYDYQPAIDFAINRLRFSAIDKCKKLSLGLSHGQDDWVRSALRQLYQTGELRLTKDDIEVMDKHHLMVLFNGEKLFAATISQLVSNPPGHFVKDSQEWMSLTQCDDDQHVTCIKSINAAWRGLKERVEQRKNSPYGEGFSLQHFRDVLENGILTPSMNVHCRSIFIDDICYRAGEFHERIINCIRDALVGTDK